MRNIKKYIITIIFLFTVCLQQTSSFAQTAFCKSGNTIINDGEKITYQVYYNLGILKIPAGEAIFSTQRSSLNGKDVFHIIGSGNTYKSYDYFFKVRDKYQTWIDPNTMLPLKFQRQVREGNYSYDNTVLFDRDKNKAKSKSGTFNMPECIQDVISAIYYARNIDYSRLNPGDKIPFQMFIDEEIQNMYIRYMGRGTITTKYGTFKAIKISPLLLDGTVFKEGQEMILYASDDNNKIPLRIITPISVGSVRVDLISYENLKYPLAALQSLN